LTLVVATASVVLIAVVLGQGLLGINNPSVTITGVYPSNLSTISENRPEAIVNLTLGNVQIDSLIFTLYVDGTNATGGATLSPGGVRFTLPTALAEGNHEAAFNASFGKSALASASWRFNVDTSPPSIHGITPANGSTHAGDGLVVSVNFTDTTEVDISRSRLTVDGIDVTNFSYLSDYGISYAPSATLSEGEHGFALELSDSVGNNASYSWSLTVKYPVEDFVPPYITDYSPANNSLVSSANPLVWFHINDTLSGVDVGSSILKIDNIPVAFQYGGSHLDGWTISYSKYLTDNNHSALLYVVDHNNNSRTEEILFTVDSTPPIISGITPVNGSTLNTSSVIVSAHFTDLFSGVDPSTVMLMVDSLYNPASATITSSGLSYSAQLTDGVHSVTIRISDLAGNTARANWAFTVDTPSNYTEPSESVIMLTKTGYFNTESGLPTIVGEIKNNGTTTVKDVLIKGLFMCSDGKVINNDKRDPAIIYGYAEIKVLEPGGVSPFKLEMPADFPDFTYILSQLAKFDAQIEDFSATTDIPYKGFSFSNVTGTLQPDGHYKLTAVITNTGSGTISDTKVVGTFYTPTKPIAVESAHVYSLEPGESAFFMLMVEDDAVGPLITRHDLKASA
jgi:hypothetical protein